MRAEELIWKGDRVVFTDERQTCYFGKVIGEREVDGGDRELLIAERTIGIAAYVPEDRVSLSHELSDRGNAVGERPRLKVIHGEGKEAGDGS